eukprot:m.103749 g.103749  ORF g.103749 m.103749 type:complete len:308 (-) comp13822_c0_seq2:1587-2510(-)
MSDSLFEPNEDQLHFERRRSWLQRTRKRGSSSSGGSPKPSSDEDEIENQDKQVQEIDPLEEPSLPWCMACFGILFSASDHKYLKCELCNAAFHPECVSEGHSRQESVVEDLQSLLDAIGSDSVCANCHKGVLGDATNHAFNSKGFSLQDHCQSLLRLEHGTESELSDDPDNQLSLMSDKDINEKVGWYNQLCQCDTNHLSLLSPRIFSGNIQVSIRSGIVSHWKELVGIKKLKKCVIDPGLEVTKRLTIRSTYSVAQVVQLILSLARVSESPNEYDLILVEKGKQIRRVEYREKPLVTALFAGPEVC